MNLQQVQRVKNLTPDEFRKNYLEPQIPVIFTGLIDNWPAKNKWTIEYFKEKYGEVVVPLYSENYSSPGQKYMSADLRMKFGEYLDLLQREPTPYRMFLFNIFEHAPELVNDFSYPTIMNRFIKEFPFMFFGGAGTFTRLHYDIDLSDLFLTQFHGRKRIVLFSPDMSRYLYRHPFTVKSHIDVNNPDYERFPALMNVIGFDCTIHPGETLFMPSGFWHHVEYTDGGYSLTLRANESYYTRAKGLLNIATHYVVDKGLNNLFGEYWLTMKTRLAEYRAEN